MKMLTIPEFLKPVIDTILDYAENKAKESPNKVDDAVVFACSRIVRTALDVPDDD